MAAAVVPAPPKFVHVGLPFDIFYVALLPLVCITAGCLLIRDQSWFELILTLNMWLLGYHHVIATYTRIGFDRASISEHRFEVLLLPLLVVLSVAVLVTFWGAWLIGTIYLHWQWYHYTRQSEGVAKSYLMKSGDAAASLDLKLFRTAFYVVSATPFLMVGTRDTHKFLAYDIWVLPLAASLQPWLFAVFCIAGIALLSIVLRWLIAGKTSAFHAAYVFGHVLIYGFAYGICQNLDQGWLALSMWHNTQYLLFVWMFNRKRFKGGYEPSHALISYLSQPGRAGLYFLATLLFTAVIYGAFEQIIAVIAAGYMFQATVIVYQTMNFHHYIVDSRIWKLRKTQVGNVLTHSQV